MILTIDVGNTRIKGAVFENNSEIAHFVFSIDELVISIDNILKQFKSITILVVASVGKVAAHLFTNFTSRVDVHFINHSYNFPFTNQYETPLTLGIDRMVLAAGAVLAFPEQNRLVIDAGTCITYDFVNDKDLYVGGAISPGIRLRYESLHHHTAKLPLLSVASPENFIGKSTAQSIHSGVVNGVIHEIDGFIAQYSQVYPKFIIILTGGDAVFLAKQLKNTIFANSNFLLESLNHLYLYKDKK